MSYLSALYRIALSFWVGGAALFTFVLTPTLFGGYDRDTAGGIVGVLFPGYFRWGLACGVVALLARLALNTPRKGIAAAIIAAMLLMTSAQAFVVEPRAAALKKEIKSFVTTSPEDPLRQEFRKFHALSSSANLLVLAGGVALLILL